MDMDINQEAMGFGQTVPAVDADETGPFNSTTLTPHHGTQARYVVEGDGGRMKKNYVWSRECSCKGHSCANCFQ